jgi:hypothetical protein
MFTDISFSDLLFIQNLQWWSNWEIGLFNRNAQWILELRLLGIDFLQNKIGFAWTSISAHFLIIVPYFIGMRVERNSR